MTGPKLAVVNVLTTVPKMGSSSGRFMAYYYDGAAGTQLSDNYVLGAVIGQGAFGKVYECRQESAENDEAPQIC